MKSILEKAPMGVDRKKIIEGLILKGHTIEGIDPVITASYKNQRQAAASTVGNQFEEQPKSFWEKARNVASNIVGGGELAKGLGLGIAAPQIQEQLTESEQQMSDTELAIVKRINEKKSAGEDTTRLQAALQTLQADMGVTRDVQTDFTENLPSNKQVIGSAARLAGTVAGGAIAGQASKLTGAGKATSALSGLGRGAAAGAATGVIEGGIQGAGLAAEADKSSEEILYSGILGSVGGGITGGVLGGTIGAVSGGLKGRTIKREQFVKDFVSPKMTVKDRAEAIRQGRLQDPTLFGKAEISFSKRDAKIADAVDDVISPKATISENIDAIKLKIDQTDSGVKRYIQDNKIPYNTAQLRSKLETGKEDLKLIFASDKSAERTYDAVTDAFMDTVGKKDTLGLFQARQDFDQIPAIQKLLQNDKLGENARKEIVLAVRGAANDYIATQLPKNNPYKAAMLNQRYALEALGNIADKSASIVGKNNLQILTDKYPVLKWVIGGVATGITGAAGIGVGSALIGSSEN